MSSTPRTGWLSILILAGSCLAAGSPAAVAQRRPEWDRLRKEMVDKEIVAAGIRNPRVIEAMGNTPRHEFVGPAVRNQAYLDMALPIGESQTISPPFVVAYMTESLDPQPTDKVLEIGTGSGYQAAVLSPLVHSVYSIEIVPALAQRAARTLGRLGYANVFTKQGDGYLGWPEQGPFDKIIVTCSPESVPAPLVDQLREGGLMIVPLGERYQQTLYLFRKQQGRLEQKALLPTLFVPMTGAAETRRQVLPDPSRPAVYNGGFEELVGSEPAAMGWHYQRQLTLPESDGAPSGGRYALFVNREPGRGAQALQGMGLDGRTVQEIEVTCWIRGREIRALPPSDQLAMLMINFYDENRGTASSVALGPFSGSFAWKQVRSRFQVPASTREAILGVGLFGAVGELAVDDVELTVSKRRAR